ncbi:hypothetical protein V6N13_139391 [Hibiscus sabdariffa]|uniref:Uncharacterized protein n=1 Tax=Hibiscus sabdariffa TaxID=183260 RepID=A0ABR2C8L0_9ROSI
MNKNREIIACLVQIRLSTTVIYGGCFLLVLHPSGVKKTGETQLALRFSCSSLINILHKYSHPLLPKMHYIHPLSVIQLDVLRQQAIQIVLMRQSRGRASAEEVVEYMLDVDSHVEHEEKRSKFLHNHGSSEFVDCCWKMD